MKLSGLLIAAIVLALLSGALYWSNHHPPAEATTKASDAPPKILTLKEGDVSKIDIKKKGAEEVALDKNASSKWQITAPKAVGADQDAVSAVVSTLSSLNSDRLVEDKASDLNQYGLSQPNLEIDVTAKDQKPMKLLIGDDTPTGSASFAKLENDPRVFTIASYNKTSIDKSLNDLRDKRLLTADFDKLTRVEVITKQQELEFGRNKQEWQIVKPRPLRADNYQVEDLVRRLKDAKMELGSSGADAKKPASGFASGTQVATAKVTDASSTQVLQVRKNKDDYYAKSSAVEGVYKVGSDLGTGLDKKLDDFRNKKLFDFGYEDVNKIELHDGGKAYFLTKGGEDWWSDGKKMDASTIQPVIDKLRNLSASKFPDSGFTTPLLDATVTSNDNKRVEKVLIAKNGDRYIAKRENEPALYELDSRAVTELQKAAGDVKAAPAPTPAPAPAPKKKK
jgi:uncharacterized protein DUF4340